MNLADLFVQNWKQRFPDLPMNRCRLVLATSGGIDSVVLADLLYKAGVDFVIAHCNFQLRGEESERDEAFVRALEQQYHKPVVVKRFDTKEYAQQKRISIQEAARELRYTWFHELVDSLQTTNYPLSSTLSPLSSLLYPLSPKIATAHHANDSIETLLMNFFRGTGISGLHGILPEQGHLIRPLLFAKREQIKAYAEEHQLAWVEDSSNASEKYTRNFFRLQLLPAIKTNFPKAEENLLHNIDRFTEAELLYKQAVTAQLKKLVEQKGTEIHIPVLKLLKTPAAHTLLWEVLGPLGFSAAQTAEVMKMLQQGDENSSYVASEAFRAIKNRNWLIIAPLPAGEAQHILIEPQDKKITFRDGVLHFATLPVTTVTALDHHGQETALLDAGKIAFPLLLRPWKQGDYFYPLGMPKKKKVSRFLIDQKLSATAKEKVWVLEAAKKIVWITGMRIDDRYKITAATSSVLQIVVEPA